MYLVNAVNTTLKTPIGVEGDFKSVPKIDENLSIENAHLLIPQGFEDIISYAIDPASNSLAITILNEEEEQLQSLINIPQNLFNPAKNNCSFPKFLIEQSTKNIKGQAINYFQEHTNNRYVFNQNELAYIVIQHRLCEFSKHKNAYSNLLNNDISSVMSFISYVPCNAYNAIQKVKNSYIVMSIFDKFGFMKKVTGSQNLGDILKFKRYIPNKFQMDFLFNTLPIHFSSESGASKVSKYILNPFEQGAIYRSVGHDLFNDSTNQFKLKSIFKAAQNIPARNKTHVTADAKPIANFKPESNFLQDWLPNPAQKRYDPKDNCYIKAYCVFHPMDTDNCRFVFGEIEASERITSTPVIEQQSVSDQFEEITAIKDHLIMADKDGSVTVGTNIAGDLIKIEDCISATLINTITIGSLGVQKLQFNVVRPCGNIRLDSNTGLKGVTKTKPKLGTIHFPTLNKEIKPDLVLGMNSFKAKGNGIALARAALAVDLEMYKPKHFTGLLNTLDINEINAAQKALPEFYYEDEFGKKVNVNVGIVYVRVTELTYIYKSYKPQTFSHEAGRMLFNIPDNRLFHNIWDNYINPVYKEAVIEFEKILIDKRDLFEDSLPSYTVKDIKLNKIFNEDKDLIRRTRLASESNSKLLDEDWNKGFFIDLTPNGGSIIRIPSAKLLNIFSSQIESKMYMYPHLLVVISKILSAILSNKLHYIFSKTETKRQTLLKAYYGAIKGMLYSDEDSAMMMIQKLSRPEINGIAMKQSTDYLLPDNVAVIFDRNVYNQAAFDALGKDYVLHEMKYNFYGLHVRNPCLWKNQLQPVKIWNEDDLRIYLHHKHNIKLDDYLSVKHNKDIILFSKNILNCEKSDVDKLH